MNLKHDLNNLKEKYRDVKWRVKHGEYDEQIVILLGVTLTYVTVSLTLLLMRM